MLRCSRVSFLLCNCCRRYVPVGRNLVAPSELLHLPSEPVIREGKASITSLESRFEDASGLVAERKR